MSKEHRVRGTGVDPERVLYDIVDTSLGPLLVAATERGVCYVSFGDSATELEDRLARRFAASSLGPADARVHDWAGAIAGLAEGRASGTATEIPLDLRGTEFQTAVWEQLRAIPAGSTISYGELARRVGRPRAVRAVAQACGANPVGVVVPCHRVIGSNGSLTGFAGGIERKRALLEREGAL